MSRTRLLPQRLLLLCGAAANEPNDEFSVGQSSIWYGANTHLLLQSCSVDTCLEESFNYFAPPENRVSSRSKQPRGQIRSNSLLAKL